MNQTEKPVGKVDDYDWYKMKTFLICNPRLPIPIQDHVLKCKKAFLARKEDEDIEDEYGIYPYVAEEMYNELYPPPSKETDNNIKDVQSVIDRSYSIIESEMSLEDALQQIQQEFSEVTNYYYKVISNSGIKQTKRLLNFLDSIA